TWDAPITLEADYEVPQGTTLTIEPGVTVTLAEGVALLVEGELVARGTEDAPVTFTGDAAAPWGGVVFAAGAVAARFDGFDTYAGGSSVEHAVVENATRGMELAGASPYLRAVTFQYNVIPPTVDTIGGAALLVSGAATPRVRDCRFEGNVASSFAFGGAIYVDAADPILQDNVFLDNEATYGGAVSTELMASPIVGSTFEGNESQSEGGGVSLVSTVSALLANTFTGNYAEKDGGGIHVCVTCDPHAAPYLLDSLKDESSRETAARLLGNIGAPVMDSVLNLLGDESFAEGALRTLEFLPLPPAKPILDFARMAVSRSGEYDALRRGINLQVKNEAMSLLEESLHENSHRFGILALRAIGLLGDRESMNLAVENLQTRDAGDRADVIEALEAISAKYKDIVQPLTRLWENDSAGTGSADWERLLNDPDEWIRDCAAYAAHQMGVKTMENLETLSLMDRILFFKRVPLFANLSPVDIKQVALLAEEEVFSDGEEIAHEGEAGDVMFIIVSGEVKVCSHKDGAEVEIARRTAGDYVGEMSIIGREPRMASLVAVGDVRALCIDQKSFEGLIRERPDVSLAVMKVLGQRLKE
ncbi:MAG: hypothetical protein DYG87_13140, partial [Anaerolineae bacterium CFX3]|nr:hypothetical protein [Anaerolineae bacterium CFX3]